MTDLGYYVDLLHGTRRISAFRDAIRAVVRPGDRVLEVGCGLGTYAVLAARAGAGSVWAVERDPVVHVAEALAAANGVGGSVVCIRGDATGIALPSGIDVLIFEDFPTTLLDARTHRLLTRLHTDAMAEDGRMVPSRARLAVAPVQSEPLRRRLAPPAVGGADPIDWAPLRELLAHHPRQGHVAPADLLAPPLRSDPFPLRPLPTPEVLSVRGTWEATTAGMVHALALWFDLEVAPGIWLSNEPTSDPEPWGQVLLPLEPPLGVGAGDRVAVDVRREALPSGAAGWLTWEAACGLEVRRGHEFAGLALGVEDVLPDATGSALQDRGPGRCGPV